MNSVCNSPSTYKIYCGNLSSTTTGDDLHILFSKYGNVVEAVVMTGKGFGFVHMSSYEEGSNALYQLKGKYLHGREMVVEQAINSKRPTMLPRRDLVGKGVANLDDFSEFGVDIEDQNNRNNDSPSLLFPRSRDSPTSSGSSSVDYINILSASGPSHSLSNNSSGLPSPLPYPSPSLTPDYSCSSSAMSKLDFDNNLNSIINNKQTVPQKTDSVCGICGENYNEINRIPKVLACTHTFCSDCLIPLIWNNIIKCPFQCKFITTLVSGITGLPTNSICIKKLGDLNSDSLCSVPKEIPLITMESQSGSPFLSDTSISSSNFEGKYKEILPEQCPVGVVSDNLLSNSSFLSDLSTSGLICCTCYRSPPEPKCTTERHKILTDTQACSILQPKLQSHLDASYNQLRNAMTMRAVIKERMESTIHSLSRFAFELKRKVEGEELEEAMLQSLLAELSDHHSVFNKCTSSYQLIEAFKHVQSYDQSISAQYSQAMSLTAINNATEAIILKLKDPYAAGGAFGSLGLNLQEAFSMETSLEDHALSGNCANVLLMYMVSDLLASRMHQTRDAQAINQQPSTFQQNKIPYSLRPISHTHINNIDTINLNHVIETTNAIEAGVPYNENQHDAIVAEPTTPIITSAISLGLNNLNFLGAESSGISSDDNEDIYLELHNDENNDKIKPVSYLDAAKKPAKQIPIETIQTSSTSPVPHNLKSSGKFPICWMSLSINGSNAGRIVFQLRPDKAPRMCENFVGLCSGKAGYGYKDSHFFKSGDGFLAGGDIENDDGTGGYSVFEMNKFEADLCPLKDEVGMIRFKGTGTSDKGRGMIGSQFMIWYAEREFKKFSFSLVFGKVVDGMEIVKHVASLNLSKIAVHVDDCGAV